jgi:hypothetical protein
MTNFLLVGGPHDGVLMVAPDRTRIPIALRSSDGSVATGEYRFSGQLRDRGKMHWHPPTHMDHIQDHGE